MKLSVNEVWLTGLWVRNGTTIQQVLIFKLAFGPENLPGLFEKRATGPGISRNLSLWRPFDHVVYTDSDTLRIKHSSKMAARNAKHSISTILRENRGCEQTLIYHTEVMYKASYSLCVSSNITVNYRTYATTLQYTCCTQTDNHFTTTTYYCQGQRQTGEHTGSSIQDQMLRMLGYLAWWNRQKP